MSDDKMDWGDRACLGCVFVAGLTALAVLVPLIIALWKWALS